MLLPHTTVSLFFFINTTDADSPLYNISERAFVEKVRLVNTVFSGMDSCTGREVAAMYSYPSESIVWNHRFATGVEVDPSTGRITVDMHKFHELRPTLTIWLLALQRRFIKKLRAQVRESKDRRERGEFLPGHDEDGIEMTKPKRRFSFKR